MDTKLGSRRNLLSESPLHPGQSWQGLWPGPNSTKLQVGSLKGLLAHRRGLLGGSWVVLGGKTSHLIWL